MAATLPRKTSRGRSPGSGREIQSRAFFSRAGKEPLYSGDAMAKPSCRRASSFKRLGGGRQSLSGFQIAVVDGHGIVAQVGQGGFDSRIAERLHGFARQFAVNGIQACAARQNQDFGAADRVHSIYLAFKIYDVERSCLDSAGGWRDRLPIGRQAGNLPHRRGSDTMKVPLSLWRCASTIRCLSRWRNSHRRAITPSACTLADPRSTILPTSAISAPSRLWTCCASACAPTASSSTT